jgi:hypothetical protein
MAVKRCAVSSRNAKGSRRPNTSSAMHMYVSPSSHSRWNRWLPCAYEMRLWESSHTLATKQGKLEESGAALRVQLVAHQRVGAACLSGWALPLARYSLCRKPGVASGSELSGRRTAQPPSQQAQCCSDTERLPRWLYAWTERDGVGARWDVRLSCGATAFCCGGILRAAMGVRGVPADPRAVVSGGVCTTRGQQQWRGRRQGANPRVSEAGEPANYLSTDAVLDRMFTATSAALESPALHHQMPRRQPHPSPPCPGRSCTRDGRVRTPLAVRPGMTRWRWPSGVASDMATVARAKMCWVRLRPSPLKPAVRREGESIAGRTCTPPTHTSLALPARRGWA